MAWGYFFLALKGVAIFGLQSLFEAGSLPLAGFSNLAKGLGFFILVLVVVPILTGRGMDQA
jgi:hypothetical protein